MTYKVVQWATGSVGAVSLRRILEHPDLELVGVLVHDPAKAGIDAGRLCGLADTGVTATTDIEAILALDADCVSHNPMNTHETTAQLVRVLESGKNVVSCALLPGLFPQSRHVSQRTTELLEAACQRGQVSCFITGIDPGFASDAMAIFLMSLSGRIDRIRMLGLRNYNGYDDAFTQFDWFGFGKRPDSEVPPFLAPHRLIRVWGPVVEMVAAGMGVVLDELTVTTERFITEQPVTGVVGTIEAGSVGAYRFAVQGMVGDRPLVVRENIARFHPTVAPELPQPSRPGGCYRVEIEGWPNYELELTASDEHGDEYLGMEAATGLRPVNAIPSVCHARPGVLTPFDLGEVRAARAARH
ncbi:MAG: ord 3 [Acidimicrobiia bacterium]|nr:ord 3 [Acidimicrobiia bacterium]